MTLKNPALLKTKKGATFLDYWFDKAKKGRGYKESLNGGFDVDVHLHVYAITKFPKSIKGLCGVMSEFELDEGSLYQVGLRELVSYVCKGDEYLDINVEGLPNVLARDWKKHVGDIAKL